MTWKTPFQKAALAGAFIIAHLMVALLFVGAIYLIEELLERLGDPKLFDRFPLRYIFDAIDLGILAVFGFLGLIEAYFVFRDDPLSEASAADLKE